MRKPLIVSISIHTKFDNKLVEQIDSGIIGCRRFGDFYILKVTPMRESIQDSVTMELGTGLKIKYQADVIFDMASQTFVKNRYNGSTLNGFPETLKRVFAPTKDILKGMYYDDLISAYSKMNLIEAIYLTDTYKDFCDDINPIDYQLVRYKYGKEVPKGFIPELVERYPEKLI